jgi:prepilin-type N-terminal cleavage/methylation domain-containing protein
MRAEQWSLSSPADGEVDSMKRTGKGFTLIELVIVLLVTSVILAIAFHAMRSFMQGKFSVSNHVRSLTIALQQARMRALAGKTYADITQHQSDGWDDDLGAYKTVRFTSTNHGFDDGDYVTFSGLTQAHTAMNAGTYRVTSVDANHFTCPFYHTTSESRSEPSPYPKARNLSRASKLVIIPLSDALVTTDSVVASFRDDPKNTVLKERPDWALISQRTADYYIYRDEGVLIRDSRDPSKKWVTVAFDSRGLALDDGGYEVWVDAVADNSGVAETRARSVVSVSPFGMVRPGR